MTERTFETGGEVLRVGDTVVVSDGNSQKELAITSIGTTRIFIESGWGYKPVPYSKETRQSQQGAYGSVFRTKTEAAAAQRRELARARLRDLGMEARLGPPGKDGFSRYSTEALERVAVLLEQENSNDGESGQG
jgi:hypothetical protein